MEQQIKDTFYKAMSDMLNEAVQNEKMSEKDVKWLVDLYTELRDRINNLTPNRPDLHAELAMQMDIDLLKQMLLNSAFDAHDFEQMVDCVFSRLLMLCAPVQDSKIKELKMQIITCEFPHAISMLIFKVNEILDEICDLKKKFYEGQTKSESS